MSKPSLVIVVLEDGRQEMLMRRYLIRCGFKEHQWRIQRSPSGRGSAEGWVKKEFVKETKVYRSRQPKARTALVVMIDADAHTVQDRLNQLDQALTGSGQHTLAQNEKIARLIPKRNVETWILCLNGQAVNQDTDHKPTRNKDEWNELIPSASATLRQWVGSQIVPPNYCVASLRTGVQELKRLASESKH
jgi:hypothetical protein